MERKENFGAKLERFFNGKGFYIVLFLCIAVIGVSAWIMLFYDKSEGDVGEMPIVTTDVISSPPEDMAEQNTPEPEADEPEVRQEIKPAETQVAEVSDEPSETVSASEPEPEAAPAAAVARGYIWPLSGEVTTG